MACSLPGAISTLIFRDPVFPLSRFFPMWSAVSCLLCLQVPAEREVDDIGGLVPGRDPAQISVVLLQVVLHPMPVCRRDFHVQFSCHRCSSGKEDSILVHEWQVKNASK